MKIIEGLKEVQALRIKISDLSRKINTNSAHREDCPTEYVDPKTEVQSWQGQIHATTQRIEDILLAITKTNLSTKVALQIGGKSIEKSIAAWIYRRRELAQLDKTAWAVCTNRRLATHIDRKDNDKVYPVVLNYDAKTRDNKVDEYESEPGIIDARLETVNATTDLLDI